MTGNTPKAAPKAAASTNSSTPAHGQNDKRLAEFNAEVRKFGAAEGSGTVSRPALARKVVSAAADGIIVVADVKHVWQKFQAAAAKARGGTYVPEKSEKQQISKLAAFAKLGALKTVDPIAVMDSAVSVRETMSSDQSTAKGLSSPFDDMLKVAREQCRRPDAELTEEEIAAIYMPDDGEAEEAPLWKQIGAMAKKAEAIYEGDEKKGRKPYRGATFTEAMEKLREVADELKKQAKAEEDKAAKHAAGSGK